MSWSLRPEPKSRRCKRRNGRRDRLAFVVAGGVPVVGVAVSEHEQQHKRLTVAEAQQLAASLVDAADMHAAGTTGDAS
jgi:hypothetical protein